MENGQNNRNQRGAIKNSIRRGGGHNNNVRMKFLTHPADTYWAIFIIWTYKKFRLDKIIYLQL